MRLSFIAVPDNHAAGLAVGEFVEIAAHNLFETNAEAACHHCNEPKHVSEFVHDVVPELETVPADKENLVVVDFDFATSPASAIKPKPR